MTDAHEKEDDEEYEDEEATSESEEEYEDEAEDAEASDESEESEGEDSVASWGYEEKKSRFSKEVLAGFAAIVVLGAVFFIVVYKKMPGTGDSTEVAAGPEASLGNPDSDLGEPEKTGTPPEEDLNDPFREGADNDVAASNLGRQTEPGLGAETSNASLSSGNFGDPNSTNDGSTGFASSDTPGGTDSLFPGDIGSGPDTSNDPFSSNSESPDLFSGQPELGSSSEQPFGSPAIGTSTATDQFGQPLANNESSSGQPNSTTAFPGSGPNEFADSTRRDPFGGPDLSGGTGSSSPDSGPTELGSNESSGNDLFPQDNQFAQTEPNIDGSLNSSLSGDSGSALQPETIGGANEPGTPTNEPFGTSTDNSLTNEPFGSNAGSGNSEPSGLFDRSPETSLRGGDGLNDPSSTGPSSNPGFGNDTLPGGELGNPQPSTTGSELGSLDSGQATTSSAPFGNEEPFGTSDTGSTDSVFGTPETTSPSTSNDPFGNSTNTASNDPFPASTSEPVNLFPDTSSQPASTASNEPFQPPITSSPGSSFPNSSASSISGGPFGSEAFSADSSSRPSTFASQPSNSGNYTVQDGDSYWNISKKVYGTAKYFQVLADHNRRTIADPQKMKAGVAIETPPASVLQGRMKTVRRTAPSALAGRIEASGRADRSGSAGSVGSASSSGESVVVGRRETKPKQPAGILFNEQGYPMFRIGETDTLTSISSDHLGRASRWQQVYNMNRDQLQSPDKLQIGMLLKLPADASRVPLVDRTSSLR
ncbi:MAG: LysM peptidoglycan-binding domain-containing protein [Planctomycetales bacterium]